MSEPWRYLLGFAFSIFGGDLIIRFLMRSMWAYLCNHNPNIARTDTVSVKALKSPLGMIERLV